MTVGKVESSKPPGVRHIRFVEKPAAKDQCCQTPKAGKEDTDACEKCDADECSSAKVVAPEDLPPPEARWKGHSASSFEKRGYAATSGARQDRTDWKQKEAGRGGEITGTLGICSMHTDYIHDGSISRAASVLVTSKRTPKPVARLINEIPGAPHMSRKKKRRKPHRRQQSDSAFSAVDKKKGVDGGNSCAVDATRYPQQHSGVTPETAKKPKRKRIKQPDEAAAEDARTSQGYEKVLKRLKHEMLSNTHGYAACPSTSTQYASIGSEADLVDSGGVEGPVAQPIDPVPEKPVSLVMRPCPFANVPDEQISLVSQDMLSPPPLEGGARTCKERVDDVNLLPSLPFTRVPLKHEQSFCQRSKLPRDLCSSEVFEQIQNRRFWRQSAIRLLGNFSCFEPRESVLFGESPNLRYGYTSVYHQALPFEALPCLLPIKEFVERESGRKFNSVFCNLYREGRNSMGWHADDEQSLEPESCIASVSLGASRSFMIRRKRDNTEKFTLQLEDGDILYMHGAMQREYVHCVPKTKNAGIRINLTFRTLLEDKSISNAEFDAKQRDQRVLMNRAREYERLRLIKNHPDFKPDQHFRAGQTFPSRIDLWVCGIHGRQMGSVAGNKKSGLQSVLLTNCPGNIDLGGVIIYQGPGFTSFCSQNQAFVDASRHPASKLIARACLDQRAFRLLRGANRASPYAPSEGFRYDGKYLCMLYWLEQHDRGLGWRFLFVRAPGEPTARWTQRETRVQVQIHNFHTHSVLCIREGNPPERQSSGNGNACKPPHRLLEYVITHENLMNTRRQAMCTGDINVNLPSEALSEVNDPPDSRRSLPAYDVSESKQSVDSPRTSGPTTALDLAVYDHTHHETDNFENATMSLALALDSGPSRYAPYLQPIDGLSRSTVPDVIHRNCANDDSSPLNDCSKPEIDVPRPDEQALGYESFDAFGMFQCIIRGAGSVA